MVTFSLFIDDLSVCLCSELVVYEGKTYNQLFKFGLFAIFKL